MTVTYKMRAVSASSGSYVFWKSSTPDLNGGNAPETVIIDSISVDSVGGITTTVVNTSNDVQESNDFVVGNFTSVINVTQSTRVVYTGPVTDIVLSAGTGPHIAGKVYEILFPYQSVTSVSVDSNLRPSSQPVWDPLYAYRVVITCFGNNYLLTNQRLEDPSDVDPPDIVSAVMDDDRLGISITFNEGVTVSTTGITLSGTSSVINGSTGSGSSWELTLNSATALPGDTLALVMSNANIYDSNSNRILDGSYPITNNLSYPTITSASVDSATNQLVISFSENVNCTGVTGLTLTGTTSTITAVVSGSGTSNVRFSLSEIILTSVTLDVASINNISATTSGLYIQEDSDISVEVTAPPSVVSAVTNTQGTQLTVVFDEAVNIIGLTGLALSGSTSAELDSIISGSGSTNIVLGLSPSSVFGDTISFDVSTPNDIVSASTGLSPISSNTSVTNNTAEEIPPIISSVTVNASSCTIVFDVAVNVTGVTGLSFTGTSAEFSSVSSGSGTTSVQFSLNPSVEYGETVTLDIASSNDITAVDSGAALEAATDIAVTNNTPDVTVYLNDTFDTLDALWRNDMFDTLSVVSGQLEVSGGSYGRTYYNDSLVPSDLRVTATITDTQRDRSFWGIMARHEPSTGTGIRLFSQSGGSNPLTVGDSQGYSTTNVTVTVTGGFPASWSTAGNHEIAMTLVGTTVTIYCDGVEYGTADISSITTTGDRTGFCGGPPQQWNQFTLSGEI